MKANFEEIVKDDLQVSNMKPGALIAGKIMDIQKSWVVVDTHLKTESILPREQFDKTYKDRDVEIGDEIELMLESVENGLGRTQVSYGKALFWRKWLELEKAQKDETLVEGLIKNRVRGGFSVFVDGIKCFLPGSLIDIAEGVNPISFENTPGTFKIVSINRSRYNVVLTHKSSNAKQHDAEKQEFFEELMAAGIARGKVKKIMDFGAFIDLGKGEGLVYIADIMWKRINHPSDVLSVGEEYDFKVISYNREKNRISLSLREMQGNPWDELEQNIKEGQQVSGTVAKIDNYGFFVELSPGIVGLVYLTEIDWTNKSPKPTKYVTVNDKVNVQILSLDIKNRRISLGYKQCLQNPWVDYCDSHAVGDILTAPINRFNKHGLFLALNEQLNGFVHAGNIDWDSSPEDAMKKYVKGDIVKAQITILDPLKEKIALSIKKITPNVFMDFAKKYTVKESIITCKVKKIENKQVFVALDDELEGIIMASELGGDRMKDPADICKVGEELTALLWRMDAKSKRIYLSVRAITEQHDKEALAQQKKKKTGFLSTLGDILNISKPSVNADAEAAPAVEDEVATAVEDEAAPAVEDEAATAVEEEAATAVEDEAAPAVEDEAATAVEDEAAPVVEDEADPVVEDADSEEQKDKA